jgi:hypothetical protein
MAYVSLAFNFWKQTTGLTEQNLNPDNQRYFTRVATKFEKEKGITLSKTKCYLASRHAARQVKAEFGSRIMSNSKATFDMLLTAIDKTLDRKNHAIDLGAFNVQDIAELANKPRGRKRKSA